MIPLKSSCLHGTVARPPLVMSIIGGSNRPNAQPNTRERKGGHLTLPYSIGRNAFVVSSTPRCRRGSLGPRASPNTAHCAGASGDIHVEPIGHGSPSHAGFRFRCNSRNGLGK